MPIPDEGYSLGLQEVLQGHPSPKVCMIVSLADTFPRMSVVGLSGPDAVEREMVRALVFKETNCGKDDRDPSFLCIWGEE